MFLIGDKVVYPMHGIGVIDRIEPKTVCGISKEYIIIQILSNSLEIMIPTEKIANSTLRKISDNSTLESVLFNIANQNTNMVDMSTKERYQINLNKIRSGSLKDSVEVVHDLALIKKEKTLNSSENQLFNTARKFLIEEVSQIKNISEIEATDFLKSNFN